MRADRPRTPIDLDGGHVRRMRLLAQGLHACASARASQRRRSGRVERILHVSPSLFGADGVIGGGERSAYGFARAVAREIPTTLVSLGPRRASERDGELRIEIYPAAGYLAGQPFDPLGYRFLEQLRGVDVVHCHQYRVASSQLAILAGAALGKRTFITDRGGVGVHFDPDVPVQRHLSALLPMSHFSRSLLPADAPAHVIHGGVTELFLQGDAEARSPKLSPSDGRRVLYAGRIMRHKGIDVLIGALPPGVGLDVVGRVYDEDYLVLLRQLAENRDVRFVHDASDEQLRDAYRDALVTVLPSVYEDVFGGRWQMPELLGNVLLESMACATPVICSDVGGMPEVVDDGVSGFVVAPGDPEPLRARIVQLAGDRQQRDAMGRRAREQVLARFTWERAAREALCCYLDPAAAAS